MKTLLLLPFLRSLGDAFSVKLISHTHSTLSSVSHRHSAAATTTSLHATYDDTCDILVLGSGPAGCAVASLLGSIDDLDVVVASQNFDADWVPNYGVWKDEWDCVLKRYRSFGINMEGGKEGRSIDREWPVTDCYFGGSFDIPTEQRLRVDRPYCRVDRFALKKSLTKNFRVVKANHISEAIGINLYSPAGSIIHDADGTSIQLMTKDSTAPITMRAKIVIDTTGHETKLLLKDTREPYTPPGFQIAYGALVEIDESKSADKSKVGPYDKDAMTLFDYRTDHFDGDEDATIKATKAPTFMYAMPLGENRIFFEETSLVARPAMSFQACKDRCFRRLKHLGIDVTKVVEEEYCYIPMGGALPARDQRILGLGGAAAMVHPSTGYHICRALMGACDVANAIREEFAKEQPNVDRAVASAYHSLWSPDNIRQRNFANFGGEFLMKQDVVGLRGFFDGFFRLPIELWGGFLAGWPGLIYNENHETWYKRIMYGVNFILKLPPPVAWAMFTNIVSYSIFENLSLIQSVTPLLGEPESYEYMRNTDRIGDVAAKQEALRMIQASLAFAEMPTEVAAIASGSETKTSTEKPIAEAEMTSMAVELETVIDTEEDSEEEKLITIEV
ncbi:lycopene cyclase family protein [Nitzschia inconspicua]|uniref:lycopene beta-cyclase n=1 Tax=Nitzschia inconspicua TaxID=303405 RepID=A0A9K3KMP6_9STRA|nr:lycopene cyclase family protein [Nitzschia inconspicua]